MDRDRVIAKIREQYELGRGEPGAWMSIRRLAHRVDLKPEWIADAMIHLYRTDPDFNMCPESNQMALTAEDWDTAVRLGGQDNHMFMWEVAA